MLLGNWDLGGAVSRWSYPNADRLFRTVPLVPAVRVDDDLAPASTTVPAELAGEIESGLVSSVTILAGGRPVLRWPDGPHPRHLLMSVSKVFTSVLIGLLVDSGDLDYRRPVRDCLPELGDQWQGCEVGHLLDMTSGVECPEVGDPASYRDPAHPFFRFEASLGWRPAETSASPYDLVLGYGRSGRPGEHYDYTSVNTFLLAWIAERSTGLRYAEALQQLIWDRLALAGDAAICVNRSGTAVAHGGLIMSTDDLARFGALFTGSGAPGHRLAIPDGYHAMLRTPRSTDRSSSDGGPAGQWNQVYDDGDLYKSGFGGQGLYISPTSDVVIAFCGVPDELGRSNRIAECCRGLARRMASAADPQRSTR